jgi:hypothetical protein
LKGKATLVTLSNNPSMHRHLEGVGRTKWTCLIKWSAFENTCSTCNWKRNMMKRR